MNQLLALLFSIANFALLVFLLRKFLRQPAANFFMARSEATHSAIEAAHAKRVHVEMESQRVATRQQNLHQEISELRQHIEQVSQHERDFLKKRAHEQVDRISLEAKLQVEQDVVRLQQELRHKILEKTFSQVETELQSKAKQEGGSVDDSLSFLGRQLKEPRVHVGGNA